MALLPEIQDPGRFFGQSPDEREQFLRVVPLLDPSARLSDGGIDDLLRLLDSDIVLHRILAALVVGARHVRDPQAGADLVSILRRDVDGRGLLWLLLAHAIPPPDTSEGWIPQLESMTQELADRHPATFAGDDEPVLRAFDAVLLPLAFAYAGERRGMPLIEALLAHGLETDPSRAARVIRGLAAVGVYDPVAMFSLLRPARAALDEPVIRQAIVATLGSVRALYFDLVDVFLEEVRIPDPIRREVLEATDDRLVDRCVQWGGYYGNAIHACTTYPIMRQALVIDALDALGRAHDAVPVPEVVHAGRPSPARAVRLRAAPLDTSRGRGCGPLTSPPRRGPSGCRWQASSRAFSPRSSDSPRSAARCPCHSSGRRRARRSPDR